MCCPCCRRGKAAAKKQRRKKKGKSGAKEKPNEETGSLTADSEAPDSGNIEDLAAAEAAAAAPAAAAAEAPAAASASAAAAPEQMVAAAEEQHAQAAGKGRGHAGLAQKASRAAEGEPVRRLSENGHPRPPDADGALSCMLAQDATRL
jgi:hypothetical protein